MLHRGFVFGLGLQLRRLEEYIIILFGMAIDLITTPTHETFTRHATGHIRFSFFMLVIRKYCSIVAIGKRFEADSGKKNVQCYTLLHKYIYSKTVYTRVREDHKKQYVIPSRTRVSQTMDGTSHCGTFFNSRIII